MNETEFVDEDQPGSPILALGHGVGPNDVMVKIPSVKKMPLRLVLSGISAALLLTATVLMGLYLGVETRAYESLWLRLTLYNNDVENAIDTANTVKA